MPGQGQSPLRLRSALFVDFDNVYLGLQDEDMDAAEAFATEPAAWIEWMEHRMALPGGLPGALPGEVRSEAATRSLLVRRCYLSPRAFGRHRPYFIRAGFEVVDCPALTARGKNSADIRMAIDMIDILNHATQFDEFILLSSDSDFTPVLLKLRAHDRRTTVLAFGNVSGAYRSACDLTVEAEEFMENGLGKPPGPGTPRVGAARLPLDAPVFGQIAERVYEQASIDGKLEPHDLPPIYREFAEFRNDSDWLGHFSLRAMTEALVSLREELQMGVGDPWAVSVATPGEGGEAGASQSAEEREELAQQVRDCVTALVRRSEGPVTLASAAQVARQELGAAVTTTQWAGAGTFKNLLQGIELQTLAFSTVAPGYVYDTERHDPPSGAPRPDDLTRDHPVLAPIARMVHQIVDVPKLTPSQFGHLFRRITEETNANPYTLTQTSKDVRDHCAAEGAPISRGAVAFVLKGLNYAGYRFDVGENANPPRRLAETFRDNVIELCESAGLEINAEHRTLLDQWLVEEVEGDTGTAAEGVSDDTTTPEGEEGRE